MQLMPHTAQDFAIRYQIYQPIFGRISSNIIKYLMSPTARDAMKILTQGNRYITSSKSASLRIGERAVRMMIYELYDPEVNLIF